MEYPIKIFLKCPRCNGLLVFGDEYSTSTVLFLLSGKEFFSLSESLNSVNKISSLMIILKKTFITLYDEIIFFSISLLASFFSNSTLSILEFFRTLDNNIVISPSIFSFVFCISVSLKSISLDIQFISVRMIL